MEELPMKRNKPFTQILQNPIGGSNTFLRIESKPGADYQVRPDPHIGGTGAYEVYDANASGDDQHVVTRSNLTLALEVRDALRDDLSR
jgi:hypothetical protein